MNLSDLGTVVRKELLVMRRNWHALIISLILCAGYPAILFTVGFAMQTSAGSAKLLNIAVRGDVDFVRSQFGAEKVKAAVYKATPASAKQLQERKLDAIVTTPFEIETGAATSVPTIKIEATTDQSGFLTAARLQEVFSQIRQRLSNQRLKELSLDKPWFSRTEDVPVSAGDQHTGRYVSLTLPFVITVIVVAISGAFSFESINEERAHKTWHLLLVSALDRNSLLCGKLIAAVGAVFLGLLTCLGSLLTCSHLVSGSGVDIGITFSFGDALVTAVLAIPLALSMSSFLFLLCLCARNIQEANIFAAAATIVLTFLPMVSVVPSKFVAPALYLVPVVNVSLCISEALQTGIDPRHCFLAFAASLGLGAVCLYGCINVMKSESLLFNIHTPLEFRKHHGAAVLGLCTCVFLLFFYLGQILMIWNIFWGTIATQALFMATPAWLWIKRSRLNVGETMRLKPTRPRYLLGAAFLAPGVTAAAFGIAALQNIILPTPSEYENMMKSTILAGHPLWQTFIAMALTPGICEELLFRGAVLGLLCTSMKTPRAAVITACLFGLFHMSAFRFAPTGLAGLVLCCVAISTGSIYPAMILHAAHNAGAIIAAINEKNLQLWFIIPAAFSTIFGAALLGWLTPLLRRQSQSS